MAITKTGRDWKSLHAAVQQDDVAKVREIAGRLNLGDKKKYRNVCFVAAKAGASNSLEALLDAAGGFRFNTGWATDRTYAETMLQTALASQNPAPLLSVIYAANKKEEGENALSTGQFVNKHAPKEVIQSCLEKDSNWYERFMKEAGLDPTEDSTEKLKVILTYTVAAAPKSQSVLNSALITVAGTGDATKTELLLEQGAKADVEAAQSLFDAAKGKHLGVVTLLLPHVAPKLCGDVLDRLRQRQEKTDDDIIEAIEAAAQRVTAAQPTAAPAAQQPPLKDRFNRLAADVLEEMLPPSNDGSEETVRYYFGMEQAVFMTNGKATLAVSFNSLGKGVEAAMRARLDERPNPDEPAQSRPVPLQVHRLK